MLSVGYDPGCRAGGTGLDAGRRATILRVYTGWAWPAMHAARAVVLQTTSESTAQAVREWLVAFGTVGATFVAVYVGVLREWRRRPRLALTYGGPAARDAVVATVAPSMTDAAFVRLRVTAARHKTAAEDVEVMVLRAEEIEPRTRSQRHTNGIAIDGLLLGWSNTLATRLYIPPGTYRHLDLLWVDGPSRGSKAAAVEVAVDPKPVDQRHVVDSASFELELAVTARNADALRYRVVVNYDGEWGDDIWQHLSVEAPRRLK